MDKGNLGTYIERYLVKIVYVTAGQDWKKIDYEVIEESMGYFKEYYLNNEDFNESDEKFSREYIKKLVEIEIKDRFKEDECR